MRQAFDYHQLIEEQKNSINHLISNDNLQFFELIKQLSQIGLIINDKQCPFIFDTLYENELLENEITYAFFSTNQKLFNCYYPQENKNFLVQVSHFREDYPNQELAKQLILLLKFQTINCSSIENIHWPAYIVNQKIKTHFNKFIIATNSNFISLQQLINQNQLLKSLCKKNSVSYSVFARNIVFESLSAILELHQNKIAHRNVKPCNLIFSFNSKKWILSNLSYALIYSKQVDDYDIIVSHPYLPSEIDYLKKIKIKKIKQDLLFNDLYSLSKSLNQLEGNENSEHKQFINLIPKIISISQLQKLIEDLNYYHVPTKQFITIYQSFFELQQNKIEIVNEDSWLISNNLQNQLNLNDQVDRQNLKTLIEINTIIEQLELYQFYPLFYEHYLSLALKMEIVGCLNQIYISLIRSKSFFQEIQDNKISKEFRTILFRQSFSEIQSSLFDFNEILIRTEQGMEDQFQIQKLLGISKTYTKEKQFSSKDLFILYNLFARIEKYYSQRNNKRASAEYGIQTILYKIQLFGFDSTNLNSLLAFSQQQILERKKFNLILFLFEDKNFNYQSFISDLFQQINKSNNIYLLQILLQSPFGSIKNFDFLNFQAQLNFHLKEYKNAYQIWQESEEFIQDNSQKLNLWIFQSECLIQIGQVQKAICILEKSTKLFEQIKKQNKELEKQKVLQKQYSLLGKCFYLLNNLKIAYQFLSSKLTNRRSYEKYKVLKAQKQSKECQKIQEKIKCSKRTNQLIKIKNFRHSKQLDLAENMFKEYYPFQAKIFGLGSIFSSIYLFEFSTILLTLGKKENALKEFITSQLIFFSFYTNNYLSRMEGLLLYFYPNWKKMSFENFWINSVAQFFNNDWITQLKINYQGTKDQVKHYSFIRIFKNILQNYPGNTQEIELNDDFILDFVPDKLNAEKIIFHQLQSDSQHILQFLKNWVTNLQLQ